MAAGRGKAHPKDSRPSIESNRSISATKGDSDRESSRSTVEEQLLAALLGANEELLEALRQYDDLERVGIERDAEERSRKETRIDRSVRFLVDSQRTSADRNCSACGTTRTILSI